MENIPLGLSPTGTEVYMPQQLVPTDSSSMPSPVIKQSGIYQGACSHFGGTQGHEHSGNSKFRAHELLISSSTSISCNS